MLQRGVSNTDIPQSVRQMLLTNNGDTDGTRDSAPDNTLPTVLVIPTNINNILYNICI